MKKIVTFFLLLTFSFSYSFAQSYSAPESVEYDAANNRYLVACNGSTNSIQQVVPGNAPTLFTSNVSGPYGIEILGSKLWVCDGGRIKSYNLSNAALVDNINVNGTFLNGITSDGDHFLFVSDYSAKKIYRVNANTGAFYTMVANTVTSPNGLWYDGANNRVLFVNWGSNAPVKAISLADSSVTTVVTTSQTNCDGIGRDAAGNYYISSWNPQAVYKYNSSFGSPTSVVSSGLSNPADIYYNTANDTIAVPNSNNNTVTFHYVGTTVSVAEEEKEEVKIFPNPASKFINVELNTASTNADFVIQNLTGEIIYLSKISNQKSAIDISNFAAGEYIYSVQTESGDFSGRFTVIK
jgi:hypothetical protein